MGDPVSDELDARRRILTSIEEDADRAAVKAVFDRVDWRRHQETLGTGDDFPGSLYERCTDADCPVAYAYVWPPAEHYHYIGT